MSLRTPITLVVLIGVLAGAAFFGWKTVISPATEDDDPPTASGGGPKCANTEEFHKGQLIKSKDILVNVYNAGGIEGLATSTLTKLGNRGFNAGVADNAPGSVVVTNVKILTDARNAPQVKLVAAQFDGEVTYGKPVNLAPGIDLIVGDDFQGMKAEAKDSLRVKRNITTCAAVDTAQS